MAMMERMGRERVRTERQGLGFQPSSSSPKTQARALQCYPCSRTRAWAFLFLAVTSQEDGLASLSSDPEVRIAASHRVGPELNVGCKERGLLLFFNDQRLSAPWRGGSSCTLGRCSPFTGGAWAQEKSGAPRADIQTSLLLSLCVQGQQVSPPFPHL